MSTSFYTISRFQNRSNGLQELLCISGPTVRFDPAMCLSFLPANACQLPFLIARGYFEKIGIEDGVDKIDDVFRLFCMTQQILRKRFLLLFLACFLGINLLGTSATDSEERKLSDLLDQLRKEVGAPGAVLGVSSPDGRCVVVASGMADRETGRSMTPETPYYIGSATKTYTAVTILRLVEKGRLSLDDTLDHFLPAFPDGAKIQVRHLLAQTSGLKDFYAYFYYRPNRDEMIEFVTKRWSQDELIQLSGRFGRWFEPGTDWDYSSTNYFLLGVLIERAGGLSLSEAYRTYIYEPLGIKHTWLPKHEKERGQLPTGYMGHFEGWKHSEMFGELAATTVLDRSTAELSAGGLAAPAEENIRFLRAVIDKELLSTDSFKAMTQFRSTPALGFSDSKPAPGDSDGYGLGLVQMKRSGFTLLGHGGMYNGHTAGMWHVSECGKTISVYFNRAFVNQNDVIDRILPAICE